MISKVLLIEIKMWSTDESADYYLSKKKIHYRFYRFNISIQ